MQEYINYLEKNYKLTKKKAHFYGLWVKRCIDFTPEATGESIKNEDINNYIEHIINSHTDWQVAQAKEALQLYLYLKSQQTYENQGIQKNSNDQWRDVAKNMTNMLRLRQLSLNTEKTYMYWLRQFYRHINGKSPYLVESNDVKNFLLISLLSVLWHHLPRTRH